MNEPAHVNLADVRILNTDVDGLATATPDAAALAVEPIDPARWDLVCADFDDIVPEQTGAFNQAHWGAELTQCVAVTEHSKMIGGASVIVRPLPLLSTGIAFVKWGPVWRQAGRRPSRERLRAILTALREEYCSRRNLHLTVMPPADPGHADTIGEVLQELGFRQGATMPAPERYWVNTAISRDELLAGLDQKWRYNLRKSWKNDFDIRFADGSDGLAQFLDLYRQMIERKKFMDSSAIAAVPRFMAARFGEARPRVVLASHAGRITAGGIFWIGRQSASYMFGATDDRALKLRAGYAMHWWVAEHLVNSHGVDWYDLGGNDLDAGLHQFKKGFVGKTGQVTLCPPRYHFAASPVATAVGATVFGVREARGFAMRKLHALKTALRK